MTAGFALIENETGSSGIPEAARHRSDLHIGYGDVIKVKGLF